MNKDVIYIEPEDDITDILANIKDAKNKIIALVPPKKAGVLQSAVNFKLIAKTAQTHEKTVVLITADESLLTLANKVKMPTARTLQSKPKLPHADDASEFGDDDDVDDEVSAGDDDDEIVEKKAKADAGVKVAVTKNAKEKSKKPSAAAEKNKDIDLELNADDVESGEEKNAKDKDSKKKIKVPDFKKYRKFIILFAVLAILIAGFGFWATQIAPRAKITVKVKTVGANFNETVRLVTDESEADPENGVFYIEEKTTTKSVSSDFTATGEVDKGTKASGTITVTRPAGSKVDCFEDSSNLSIPANTVVIISGKQYIVTEGGSVNTKSSNYKPSGIGFSQTCTLEESVTSGKINVVAKEVGDDYNIAAASSGISLNINTSIKYSVASSAMTGGSSKIVKVVSQEDVEKASSNLSGNSDKEAREELTNEFSSDYILITSSFTTVSTSTNTSPALNEEVGDDVTPKIVRETRYSIYAVKKSDVNDYITAQLTAKFGDDTQMIYSTGVAINEGDEDKAFFESFKNADGKITAKLKSTTKTGPRITEDMVKEVSLGVKVGKVQSNLRSYNGVTEANVETSYFWVTRVPDDDNKVEIEITVE